MTGNRRRSSLVVDHRVDSFVGSLGRQGFARLAQASPKQMREIIRGDVPEHAVDSPEFRGESNNRVHGGERIDDGDGALLQAGLGAPSEATRLLHEQRELLEDDGLPANELSPSELEQEWAEALEAGKVHTKVEREIRVMVANSAPLVITFFLQYSLTMASLFSVGHIGRTELAAVSLASMTASVTGFAVIQGLATCLDTLCAQAYGAGHPMLVGMYFQKCVLLILSCLFPILVIWYRADIVLPWLVPSSEAQLVKLATEYLRIIAFGIPGYTLFECGKRFLQAQGIFHASTYVLVIAAPVNILLNYVFVWNKTFGIGFHGAPVAVACSDWLLAVLLFLYVVLVDGSKCWNGFTTRVFFNWGPLFSLAVPGVIMVESEFLAFEILTLAAAYFGTSALAAQTILSSVVSLAYQIPFALSCAASTRVANFVGAGLIEAAKTTSTVCVCLTLAAAAVDAILLYTLRYPIIHLFSSDTEVIALTAAVIPWCAFGHLFDGASCIMGGILRGQGRQKIGGYLNLVSYYVIGLPIGFLLSYKLGWGLSGVWIGITFGLAVIAALSVFVLQRSNWAEYFRHASARDRDA